MGRLARRLLPSDAEARETIRHVLFGLSSRESMEAAFPDDRSRLRLLELLRWPEGFSCPRCESTGGPERPRPGTLVCTQCRSFHGVLARTMLAGEIALDDWFCALWDLCRGTLPIRPAAIAEALDVSPITAPEIVDELRKVVGAVGAVSLDGTVELDVRPLQVGHHPHLVAVAAEPGLGGSARVRARRVPHPGPEPMAAFVTDVLRPGVQVRTDCWSGYLTLGDLPVHHLPSGRPPHETHLTAAEDAIARLRLFVERRRPRSATELDAAIDEWVFRRNRSERQPHGMVFGRVLRAVMRHPTRPRRRSGVQQRIA